MTLAQVIEKLNALLPEYADAEVYISYEDPEALQSIQPGHLCVGEELQDKVILM